MLFQMDTTSARGLLQREKLYLLMFSRNLFVLDFVRRFFVSCAQISEAYAVRTLMKFGHSWRKIGHKGRCRKDSERTYYKKENSDEGTGKDLQSGGN